MSRPIRRLAVATAAVTIGALAGGAATAPAVVPPKDCGRMTVEGKRYQVKVDQITCRSGKRYAKTYLTSRRKPSGYTCRRYPVRKNRVVFLCNNGRKQFLAIRR